MAQRATDRHALAQVQARIPAEHYRRLDAEATEHDRTISAEVRRAIRIYVEALPVEERKAA